MENKQPFYTTYAEDKIKPYFAFPSPITSKNEIFDLCVPLEINRLLSCQTTAFSPHKYNIITVFLFKEHFCGIKDKIQNQGHLASSSVIQNQYSVYKGE